MKCTNTNCETELEEGEVQLVLKMMLCPECAKGLTAFRAQLRSELENTLATLDDTLRFAFMSDELLPSDPDATPLEFIAEAQKKCRSTSKTTTSSKSTKPSATTAGGSESSPKPSAPA